MELIYGRMVDILKLKVMGAKTTGYNLPPGIYEFSDLNL